MANAMEVVQRRSMEFKSENSVSLEKPSCDEILPASGSADSCVEWSGIPKDSKRAWVVCAAAFVIQLFTVGFLHVFGNFFTVLLEEFPETSKGELAWVGSAAYGLAMLLAPLSSSIINNYGSHVSCILGSVICTISLLLTSWTPNVQLMFVSCSILYGVGCALAYTPTMCIAGDYFDKYYTVATGITVAGSSAGTLILSPVSQALLDSIGWRYTMRVFAIFALICLGSSFLLKPKKRRPVSVERDIKRSIFRRLMVDMQLWKNRVYTLYVIAMLMVMFGYYIPYVHLVSHAKDLGINPDRGSKLVMVLGGSTLVGRIMFGKLLDIIPIENMNMQQIAIIVTGVITICLPMITTFWGLIAYVISVGLIDGCFVTCLPVLSSTLAGQENKEIAWGYLAGVTTITFTVGPPVAGWMYDIYGSYDLAFHVAGIPIVAGGLLMFLIPWAQRTSRTTNIMKVVASTDVNSNSMEFSLMPIDSDLSTPRGASPPNEHTIVPTTNKSITSTQATQTPLDHTEIRLQEVASKLSSVRCSSPSLSIARPRPHSQLSMNQGQDSCSIGSPRLPPPPGSQHSMRPSYMQEQQSPITSNDTSLMVSPISISPPSRSSEYVYVVDPECEKIRKRIRCNTYSGNDILDNNSSLSYSSNPSLLLEIESQQNSREEPMVPQAAHETHSVISEDLIFGMPTLDFSNPDLLN